MPQEPDAPTSETAPQPSETAPPAEALGDDEDARIAPASLAWFLGSVLLVILSCVIYTPIIRDGWTRYDNMQLIAHEPMVQDLSLEGIKRMFSSYHHDLYQPLLTLSLATDHALNRREPAGYTDAHWPTSDLTGWHLHSLAMHLVTVVLLFLLIGRLTGNVFASWIGAALVALHPLVVEPVSWLICRTFLLAGFWILLGCHLYLSYARRPRWWLYLLSFLCFGMSMLAKLFMGLFLLPLLFDLWCQRRRWGVLIVEKLPLLALIVLLVYFNYLRMFTAQRLEPLTELSWGEMLNRGMVGVCWTAANTFLPRDLSVFYGPTETAWSLFLSRAVFGGLMMALTLVVAIIALTRKRAELMLCAAGWVVLFVPMLAAIRVRETVTSDRYCYVPLWMCALTVAWLLSRWFNRPEASEPVKLSEAKIAPRSAGGYLVSILLLAVCGWLTTQSRAHAKVWADDVLLWEAAAGRTPHRTAYGQLANALITQARAARRQGDMDEVGAMLTRAERAIQAGLEISPGDGALLENYGVLCLTRAGDWKTLRDTRQQEGDTAATAEAAERQEQRNRQALALYQRSVEVRPISAGAWNGLGVSLLRLRRFDEAGEAFNRSLELNPNYATAMRNLGTMLRQVRRIKEAEAARSPDPQTTEALRGALNEEADLLERLGRNDEAAQLRARAAQALADTGDSDDPAVLNERAAASLKAAQALSTRLRNMLAPSRMRNTTPEQQQQIHAAAEQARQEVINHARAAENAYRKLIPLNESPSPAWQGLGQALVYQGRNDEADQAFGRAVELDPNNAEAMAGYARLLAGRGKMNQAVALLEQALQIKPDLEPALFDLFHIHYSQKRVAEATQAMEKLYQYYPNNSTYRRLLGQLYEAQGRASDAARLAPPGD